MKRVWSFILAGAILAAVLLAGIAAAKGGSSIQLIKNGNTITILGSTNLAPGDRMLVEVVSAEFSPTEKGNATGFSGASGTVVVQPGSPLNTYRFNVDVSAFRPGQYLVSVKSLETEFRDSRQFVLPWTPVPTGIPTSPAAVSPPARTPSPALTTTTAPQGSPTQAPLSGLISLCAVISAALLLRHRR
ncbi:MAG: hypothetical protein LUO97_01505 [Methanomicrobiales archaeon]|nr:hypothetical protein [Methanomicrobiales archaeon]MDD1668454.1 hypothetical protein [Methanomicrobiales archaeon]